MNACVVSAAPSLVLVEGVKPDYSGPNVCGVVPALLGVRPAEWMPEPVAGARTTVLLVLDGLGWFAFERFPECLPELRAFAGGPVTTVVPSTTPAALTSITTGLPPSRHAVTGFRFRHDRGVLNAIRWQLADGTRAPDPAQRATSAGVLGTSGAGGHQDDVPHHRVHRRAPAGW